MRLTGMVAQLRKTVVSPVELATPAVVGDHEAKILVHSLGAAVSNAHEGEGRDIFKTYVGVRMIYDLGPCAHRFGSLDKEIMQIHVKG